MPIFIEVHEYGANPVYINANKIEVINPWYANDDKAWEDPVYETARSSIYIAGREDPIHVNESMAQIDDLIRSEINLIKIHICKSAE